MSVPLSELVMLPIMQESSRAASPVPSISSTTTSTSTSTISSKAPSEQRRASRKARKAARIEAGTNKQATAKKAKMD